MKKTTTNCYSLSWRILLDVLVLITSLILGAGCTITSRQMADEQDYAVSRPIVTVQVNGENLRSGPSGPVTGKAVKGDDFLLLSRRGNWCEIAAIGPDTTRDRSIERDLSAEPLWIWAPSLGLEQYNIMSVGWLLGEAGSFTDFDTLRFVLGEPTTLRWSPSGVDEFRYENGRIKSESLFGTSRFTELRIRIDRESGAVLRVEFDLPPFTGTASRLLGALSLPNAKSTESGFEWVRYDNTFPGIERLELTRRNGDFKKFTRIIADKLSGNWNGQVSITDRRAELQDETLVVILTLENVSRTCSWAGPVAEIEIVDGTIPLGSWVLGPGQLRLAPGESSQISFMIPVDAGALDIAQVNLYAELKDMTMVPSSADLRPDRLP